MITEQTIEYEEARRALDALLAEAGAGVTRFLRSMVEKRTRAREREWGR